MTAAGHELTLQPLCCAGLRSASSLKRSRPELVGFGEAEGAFLEGNTKLPCDLLRQSLSPVQALLVQRMRTALQMIFRTAAPADRQERAAAAIRLERRIEGRPPIGITAGRHLAPGAADRDGTVLLTDLKPAPVMVAICSDHD